MVLRLKTRESRSLPGLLMAMLSGFAKANNSGFASQIPQSSQHKIGPSRKHRAAASGPFCLLKSLKRNKDSCALGAGWSSPVARQAHNLKAAGSNPAPATKISSLIKDFQAEQNARLLSFAVYINATSTRQQKNSTSTHKRAVVCSGVQRLRRDLACIDPVLHPRPTTQRCPKASFPCPRFTSPESSSS